MRRKDSELQVRRELIRRFLVAKTVFSVYEASRKKFASKNGCRVAIKPYADRILKKNEDSDTREARKKAQGHFGEKI